MFGKLVIEDSRSVSGTSYGPQGERWDGFLPCGMFVYIGECITEDKVPGIILMDDKYQKWFVEVP